MNRHTSFLSNKIIELSKELESDLELNDLNLKEKSLKCAGIRAKWLQIQYEESSVLNKLDEARKIKVKEYISKHGNPNAPKFMSEKEAENSKEIKQIDSSIEEQKEVLRYLIEINKTVICSFGYDIKNVIDLTKLESV